MGSYELSPHFTPRLEIMWVGFGRSLDIDMSARHASCSNPRIARDILTGEIPVVVDEDASI